MELDFFSIVWGDRHTDQEVISQLTVYRYHSAYRREAPIAVV
jgi:hypothetical protein